MCRHLFRSLQLIYFCFASLPTRSIGQTSEDCPISYGAFNDCVGYSGDGISECERCIVEYLADVNSVDIDNNETLSCTHFEPDTCPALDYCSSYCGNCQQELVKYVECETGCTVVGDCASSGPDASSPTSAPTAQECPDEEAAYDQCVVRTGALTDCKSCMDANIPDDGIDSCKYVEILTCTMLGECPICGDCQTELTTWTNCLNPHCGTVSCSSPTASPAAAPSGASPTLPPNAPGPDDDGTCASERDEFEDCAFDSLPESQSESCKACVEAKFDQLLGDSTSTKCSTINDELCDATSKTCDCGSCSDAYEALVKCRVDGGDSGCKLMCESLDPRSGVGRRGVEPALAIPASLVLLLLGFL